MTDSERMMHRLLHDLRTPIGVAQGYLRLVRDGSLKTDADRDRALDQAAAALGQLARMCQQMAGYLDEESNGAKQPASVAAFAGRVEAVAREHGFTVVQDGVTSDAFVDLPFGVSASAGAVVRVFESALRRLPAGTATLRVVAADGELRFVAAPGEGTAPASGTNGTNGSARTFDPWREPGLDVMLACQRIARASGEIRPVDKSPDALAIAFPVRRSEV
jgi:signal transduction histidine kinase